MADIELVIKIPEELYNRFEYEYSEENLISKYTNDAILEAFCNGTPLPKGHGRLIDADAVKPIIAPIAPLIPEDSVHYEWVYIKSRIDNAPTIIEADKEE